MSAVQLSMLEPRYVRAEIRRKREEYFDRLRPEIARRFGGKIITTDDVWLEIIDADPSFAIPAGLSPNALGTVFSAWDQASPYGPEPYRRSIRRGANSNLLRQWRIKPNPSTPPLEA